MPFFTYQNKDMLVQKERTKYPTPESRYKRLELEKPKEIPIWSLANNKITVSRHDITFLLQKKQPKEHYTTNPTPTSLFKGNPEIPQTLDNFKLSLKTPQTCGIFHHDPKNGKGVKHRSCCHGDTPGMPGIEGLTRFNGPFVGR